ncbi:MAG: hypothetical protein QW568_02590 [Candidatus Anstonellaceae archaeon]
MPEMKVAPFEAKVPDYIGMYEQSIRDIVRECGSREAANQMLDELEKHYEDTDRKLKQLDRADWKDPERHASEKARAIAIARHEVAQIIDKHVPHTADHMKELIVGASLAAAALLIPASYAVSTLVVATSLVSIGSSYYIGFKMLKNWKAIAGKERVSRLAGVAHPRHIAAVHKRIRIPMTAKISKRK